MRALICFALALALVGCLTPDHSQVPYQRRSYRVGHATAALALAANGTIAARVIGCTVRTELDYLNSAGPRAATEAPCERGDPVTLTTPWGEQVRAEPGAGAASTFIIDWARSPIDPLDETSTTQLGGTWTLGHPWLDQPLVWTPRPEDQARMLGYVGRAKDVEVESDESGPPPELTVDSFGVDGDNLVAGEERELVLRLGNKGPGRAFRVYATTRSSVAELHGLRFSFGTIAPNLPKTRRVKVKLPSTVDDPDAMVVIAIEEARGYTPASVARRFPIRLDAVTPTLSLSCEIRGRRGTPPPVDAGESLRLRCQVANTGGRDATGVIVEVTGGQRPATATLQQVAMKARAAVELPVTIAKDVKIDSHLVLHVVAREPSSQRSARVDLEVVVRKPKLCPDGTLTREAYKAKRAELRAAVEAGELTAEEFDTYDAELVGCLE